MGGALYSSYLRAMLMICIVAQRLLGTHLLIGNLAFLAKPVLSGCLYYEIAPCIPPGCTDECVECCFLVLGSPNHLDGPLQKPQGGPWRGPGQPSESLGDPRGARKALEILSVSTKVFAQAFQWTPSKRPLGNPWELLVGSMGFFGGPWAHQGALLGTQERPWR